MHFDFVHCKYLRSSVPYFRHVDRFLPRSYTTTQQKKHVIKKRKLTRERGVLLQHYLMTNWPGGSGVTVPSIPHLRACHIYHLILESVPYIKIHILQNILKFGIHKFLLKLLITKVFWYICWHTNLYKNRKLILTQEYLQRLFLSECWSVSVFVQNLFL